MTVVSLFYDFLAKVIAKLVQHGLFEIRLDVVDKSLVEMKEVFSGWLLDEVLNFLLDVSASYLIKAIKTNVQNDLFIITREELKGVIMEKLVLFIKRELRRVLLAIYFDFLIVFIENITHHLFGVKVILRKIASI